MGYPLRWEEIAVTPSEAMVPCKASDQKASDALSLRRYFVRVVVLTFVGCTLLVLSVIGVSRIFLSDAPQPTLRLEALPAAASVSVTNPNVARHAGFVVVTGGLVNRTTMALNHVQAVVDLLDTDRHTLRTETAMVERDSIAPGQATGFKLAMADVHGASAYRLHFKKLYGSDIN